MLRGRISPLFQIWVPIPEHIVMRYSERDGVSRMKNGSSSTHGFGRVYILYSPSEEEIVEEERGQ